MIRAVLDANVLVSASIRPRGKSDRILRQAGDAFFLLTSEFILSEVEVALGRKHIQAKYQSRVTQEQRTQYLQELRVLAEAVQVQTELHVVSDPKDNPVLACAVDGRANFLVTGDRHLLRLKEYEKVRIVTPEEFLQILQRL